ncbi:SCP2 sterol-binding domain-containing protein [Candidatus Igneacidithiobacillus taiwanensis]|uniref:SCP2 sterol-binding domain-containing protein n=1 Tax=Candidatus Igneacidithiobacillus taiwanensis TaxID=1945924 RepID=UPI0028A00D54|nr:SCP2 sterol-binding domain-containing protein [Candidatus Igneacidithiobacillus taiwanensis]
MAPKFMSREWIRLVGIQWNTHPEIQRDLQRFDATWEYYISDRPDIPRVMMFCKGGKVIFSGPSDGRARDFIMGATLDNWKKILRGEIKGKAALLTRKLTFQGSLMTALKYSKPFEIHLNILGEIPVDFEI